MESRKHVAALLFLAMFAGPLAAQEPQEGEKPRPASKEEPAPLSEGTATPGKWTPGLGTGGDASPRLGDGKFGQAGASKTFDEIAGKDQGRSPEDGFRELSVDREQKSPGLDAFTRDVARQRGGVRGDPRAKRSGASQPEPPEPVGPRSQRANLIGCPVPSRGMAPELVAIGRRLQLAWLEDLGGGQGAVRMADHTAGRWLKTETIYSGSDVKVDPGHAPALFMVTGGVVSVAWGRKTENHQDIVISTRLMRSPKEGWTDHGSPEHTGGKRHVMPCCFQDPVSRRLGLAWLDERPGDVARGDSARLLANQMDSDGYVKDRFLDQVVAAGCPPAAVTVSRDRLVFYRDYPRAGLSDIALVTGTKSGWESPRVIVQDAWRERTCPGEGPAAAAIGETIALAWYAEPEVADAGEDDGESETEDDGEDDGDASSGKVMAALSITRGDSFGPPVDLHAEHARGGVAVAVRKGVIGVTWVAASGEPEGEILRYREVRGGGFLGPILDVSEAGVEIHGRPRMVSIEGEFFITWSEPGRGVKLARVAAWE